MALVCYPEWGCNIFGWAWYYMLDRPIGSLELGYDIGERRPPPGVCSGPEVEYQVLKGPCPFKPQGVGRSLESSVHERLEAESETDPER
jgi:hypothetical protein